MRQNVFGCHRKLINLVKCQHFLKIIMIKRVNLLAYYIPSICNPYPKALNGMKNKQYDTQLFRI